MYLDLLFLSVSRRAPGSTLFPYTTLFRSPWSRIKLSTALRRRTARSGWVRGDRKSTRLNSSHGYISYAVFCLKKKNNQARLGMTNAYVSCRIVAYEQLLLRAPRILRHHRP